MTNDASNLRHVSLSYLNLKSTGLLNSTFENSQYKSPGSETSVYHKFSAGYIG
jgi:hypothetical protein